MPQINEVKRIGRYKHISARCEACGKERWVVLHKGKPKNRFCRRCGAIQSWRDNSKRLRGSANPAWKGGRHSRGAYIVRTLEPSDFFYPMADKEGRVYEHRLVMAQFLKRCLLPWEVVHHKNSLKTDNRIENLQLLPSIKYHLVDQVIKNLLEQQNKEIQTLQARVSLLEADLTTLRAQLETEQVARA